MLPTRKRNRLQGYDYSENGAYFITVCTKDKANLLGFIPVGAVSERPPNNATDNKHSTTVGAVSERPPNNATDNKHSTTVGAIIDRPPTQNSSNATTILSSYGKILKTAIENTPLTIQRSA